MLGSYKILVVALVLTNLVTAYFLYESVIINNPNAKRSPENERVELIAGGTIPASWKFGANESPPVLKTLVERTSSNTWQIVNAEGGICFSGGCDVPSIAIHIVGYQDVKSFLNKATSNPDKISDLGYSYGNYLAIESINGEMIPILTNNNNEDKYPGMRTYFLLGRNGNNGPEENSVYYIVTTNGNPVEKDVISNFISSIDLNTLPSQAP